MTLKRKGIILAGGSGTRLGNPPDKPKAREVAFSNASFEDAVTA
jgi:molybdopterin-guanine dinucleotide biosynthesis protein A